MGWVLPMRSKVFSRSAAEDLPKQAWEGRQFRPGTACPGWPAHLLAPQETEADQVLVLERAFDKQQKVGKFEGFLNEVQRTFLHCPARVVDQAVSGYDDDGDGFVQLFGGSQEVKPRLAGKLQGGEDDGKSASADLLEGSRVVRDFLDGVADLFQGGPDHFPLGVFVYDDANGLRHAGKWRDRRRGVEGMLAQPAQVIRPDPTL